MNRTTPRAASAWWSRQKSTENETALCPFHDAPVKTGYKLRELDRFEIRFWLLPCVVPSSGAMRVAGATVDRLTDPAKPGHYEMVRAIKAKLDEWSPAIFIGHNSGTFDEHLLRQAFGYVVRYFERSFAKLSDITLPEHPAE